MLRRVERPNIRITIELCEPRQQQPTVDVTTPYCVENSSGSSGEVMSSSLTSATIGPSVSIELGSSALVKS